MRGILIDATAIPSDRGGVGRYVDGIVGALLSSGTALTVVCQARDAAGFAAQGATTVAVPASIERTFRRLLWEQITLPRLARRLGVDLIHSPHYTFPLFTRIPLIVTVHDLTFFTLPSVHSTVKRHFFRWWIRAVARSAIPVITVSESTARDFIRVTGAPSAQVTVCHLGYNAELFHQPDEATVGRLRAAIPELPDSWIAFLGTLEPRKNVVALIDGYREAAAHAVADFPSLLLSGGNGWDDAVDPAIARAVSAGADVRKLGYLPLDTLPAFLGGSSIFVYPSLGEGFGLPVLEAMATGACVLTTDRMSIPEVGGTAVAYTGITSSEIASAISALLEDDVRRASFSAAALVRAATFTWDAAARNHAAAYARAVDSG
ncbi:glycosyltransferase family 1 protein [Frigoribacterium sp. CG_9.8]|uniref:glycosyltransferase family 4 protein n=1 Tax=Frigoribacterium sp. CG_9.8 TaxID=2787733 RepID=UPI0018CBE62B|nr:glycosyltransferase family 1 protein [Frigoribacterium sp. CG_9.8]MBG6106749.1 glycosyltransferase involved in cell wall biosynthesis [Frigoribacterium sp. CG_9.8]